MFPATSIPPRTRRADPATAGVAGCERCAFSRACSAVGYGEPALAGLQVLVEPTGDHRAGDRIFRRGDPFRALYAVGTGAVKTCAVDADGREQVLGFFLPGDVLGLDAIAPGRFRSDAIALEPTRLCRLPFGAMRTLASRQPAVQHYLFRLLSRELGTRGPPAGEYGTDQRMAAFLCDLGARHAARGFSGIRFGLSMSRGDIANFLRLAPETVSRVLARFRVRGLIGLHGRALELRDVDALRALGRPLLAG